MTKMNIAELLELVKDYHMTKEEIEAQRRSFAYGNAKLANDSITKEDIDKAADKMTKLEALHRLKFDDKEKWDKINEEFELCWSNVEGWYRGHATVDGCDSPDFCVGNIKEIARDVFHYGRRYL